MSFLSLFKRLWVKVALATTLVVIGTTELVVSLSIQEQLEETHRAIRQDLMHLAIMGACNVTGEQHLRALQGTPDSNSTFLMLAEKLDRLRKAVGYKEHWYTLVPMGGDSAYFGIMSHPTPFSEHIHHFRDSVVLQQFRHVIATGQAVSTAVYEDDNGAWISGLAPIVDSVGTVVAVLEVDLTADDVFRQTERVYESMNQIRIFGVSGAIVIGLLVGLIIGRPISRVNRAVQTLTESNFSKSVAIPGSVQILPDETTELIGSVNVLSARLQSTLHDLRAANEKLAHLDKAKTTFLNFLTHELRTPISGLLVLKHVYELQELQEETREVIDSSVDSTMRLQRLSSGAEKYVRALTHSAVSGEQSCVRATITSVLVDCLPGIDLSEVVRDKIDDEQCCVEVPNNILYEMYDALIKNALKFDSERKGIVVTLKATQSEYVVVVADRGVGFDPQNASALLEPFFVDDIMSHSEGTGVSLAVAAVMCGHYGGSLQASSPGRGLGSEFTVSLPIAQT